MSSVVIDKQRLLDEIDELFNGYRPLLKLETDGFIIVPYEHWPDFAHDVGYLIAKIIDNCAEVID